MLQREVLLTRSKLHALSYEQAMAERRIRTLKSQLRQVRHAHQLFHTTLHPYPTCPVFSRPLSRQFLTGKEAGGFSGQSRH